MMAHPLFSLLQTLEELRLWFRIERHRPDSVMVTVTLVGERVEIDVFEDGHFEYSRFQGDESVESDVEQLFALLRKEETKGMQNS
jgi:hypothetical protein